LPNCIYFLNKIPGRWKKNMWHCSKIICCHFWRKITDFPCSFYLLFILCVKKIWLGESSIALLCLFLFLVDVKFNIKLFSSITKVKLDFRKMQMSDTLTLYTNFTLITNCQMIKGDYKLCIFMYTVWLNYLIIFG
jgi:hypothetical protein